MGNQTASVTVQGTPNPAERGGRTFEVPGAGWDVHLASLPWNGTVVWNWTDRVDSFDGDGATLRLTASAAIPATGTSRFTNLTDTLVLPVRSGPDDEMEENASHGDGGTDGSGRGDSTEDGLQGNRTGEDEWSRSPSPNEHGVHLTVTGNRSTLRPGEELRIAVTAQTRRNQTIYHQPGCGGSLVLELREPDGDPVRTAPVPARCEPGPWQQVRRGGWVGEAFTWNGTVWNGSAYRNATSGPYVVHANFTYRTNETAQNRSLTETYTARLRDQPGPVGPTNRDDVLLARLEANRTTIRPGEWMHATVRVANVGNSTMGLKTECWDWWAYDLTFVTPEGEERHAFGPRVVCHSLRYLALEPGDEHVLGERDVTRWNGTFRTPGGWVEAEPGNYTLRAQVRGYFPDGPNPHKRLWTRIQVQVLPGSEAG